MIPELGQIALMFSLALIALQGVAFVLQQRSSTGTWAALVASCSLGQTLCIGFSFMALSMAFWLNDFSVLTVQQHSSIGLPWYYRLGAVWGGHEGSMLLWITMLNVWHFIFYWRMPHGPTPWREWVLLIMGVINAGLIVFLLQTSNPFARDFPTHVITGNDLNPLLQDPGLMFHPPMLYLGYVGFTLVFAMAVATLLQPIATRQALLQRMRSWVLAAWLCLTLGIILGSWWAYHVLGWGGYWFWDPVENASLLPWLVSTALVHTQVVAIKRGHFQQLSILLALISFALTLLGTFLVRSGVLISVHTFASDPKRGLLLLAYLVTVMLAALVLFVVRSPKENKPVDYQLCSREALMLLNALILLVMFATVLLGTLYPLVIDVLGMGKLSVGKPYFDKVFVPLALPWLLLLGLGPCCFWQAMPPSILIRRVMPWAVLSVLLGLVFPMALRHPWQLQVTLGVSLAAWVLFTNLTALRHGGWACRQRLGMVIAHAGVAVITLAITIVSHYGIQREVNIGIGEVTQLGQYQIHLDKTTREQGGNYHGVALHFAVTRQGKPLRALVAEQRQYDYARMPMNTVAISPGLFSDFYVALGDQTAADRWIVRFYYQPLIRWIWLGGLLVLLGGGLAWLPLKKIKPSKIAEAICA